MPEPVTNPPQQDPWAGKSPEEIRNIVTDAIKSRDEVKSKFNNMSVELDTLRKTVQEREAKEQQTKEQSEKQNLEQQGKYQEALQLTEKKWNEKYIGLKTSAAQRLVPLAVNKAASAIENLTKEALNDLPDLVSRYIDINPETLEVYVKGADGKPATDSGLKPILVENFIKDFVTARPYLLKSTMPVSHGATGSDGKAITIEQALNDPAAAEAWAKADPEGFQKAVEGRHQKAKIKPRYTL